MRRASVANLAGLMPLSALQSQNSGSPTAKIVGVIADSVSGADGFEWRDLQRGDLDMILNPDDVVGIELYQAGNAPIRWRGIKDCLTLVGGTQYRGKAAK